MITGKHLAIVRAALTYWDEEMASADRSTYRHYLHSTDQETVLTPLDVADAREFFNRVEVRVALVDKTTGEFHSDRPVSLDCELAYQEGRQTPVIILVPILDSGV